MESFPSQNKCKLHCGAVVCTVALHQEGPDSIFVLNRVAFSSIRFSPGTPGSSHMTAGFFVLWWYVILCRCRGSGEWIYVKAFCIFLWGSYKALSCVSQMEFEGGGWVVYLCPISSWFIIWAQIYYILCFIKLKMSLFCMFNLYISRHRLFCALGLILVLKWCIRVPIHSTSLFPHSVMLQGCPSHFHFGPNQHDILPLAAECNEKTNHSKRLINYWLSPYFMIFLKTK